MDLKRFGDFLKQLRKENNYTQEQLADILSVSSRTVSRWETGYNMPDISILVELSELYQISLSELIKGERKSENMNEETKEVVQSLSEYVKNNEDKDSITTSGDGFISKEKLIEEYKSIKPEKRIEKDLDYVMRMIKGIKKSIKEDICDENAMFKEKHKTYAKEDLNAIRMLIDSVQEKVKLL